jgi:hypothetical protein
MEVQDFLHHLALVNHSNHAHRVLTDRAAERIGVPDLLDEGAPLFRGQAFGWRRNEVGQRGHPICWFAALSSADAGLKSPGNPPAGKPALQSLGAHRHASASAFGFN